VIGFSRDRVHTVTDFPRMLDIFKDKRIDYSKINMKKDKDYPGLEIKH
jgi:hypothetical protein